MSSIGESKGGIEIETIWSDQDVVECRFSCSNSRFAGVAEIYISHDGLSKMAEALIGFPAAPSDIRDLELGTFNPRHADGGVRLRCYCKDSVGHALMEVMVRGDGCEGLGQPESVALMFPVEAAAIDSFVRQLRSMDTDQIGAVAFLHMASGR